MKWLKTSLGLLLLISLVCADLIPIPTNESEFPLGVSGNGTIWYQSDSSNTPIQFGNVLNPINVSIIYDLGSINYRAHVCLNSHEFAFPLSGARLSSSCPAGAFGHASNSSTLILDSSSPSSVTSKASSSSYTTQTASAQLYVKPTQNGGLVVTVPDSLDLQRFRVFWSGQQCSDANTFPVGPDHSCVAIKPLSDSGSVSLESLASQYFRYQVKDAHVNALVLNVTGSRNGLRVYTQRDYYPTAEWFLNPIEETDDDDQGLYSATILSPAEGETYFFLFHNEDKKNAQTYSWTLEAQTCESGSQFGFGCSHDADAHERTPLNSYVRLSASVSDASPSGASANNGTGWSFDYFDDDDSYAHQYAYFSLADYPDLPTPYYLRVTVGNNDASDLNGAPGFFAKKGAFPSAQSNHYNMSSLGDVAHQIVVRVEERDLALQQGGVLPFEETWFFAVRLPADFSIWVGVNCATNCSDGEHGECYCGEELCNALLDQHGGSYDFYYSQERPTSLSDSAGACACSNDQYERSFDCSSKGNGNSLLYLFLIALGGLVIIVVSIGVPLYCFVTHRRAANYERV